MAIEKINGSFRDPKGYVFIEKGKFRRKITEYGLNFYDECKKEKIYSKSIKNNFLIKFREIERSKSSLIIESEAIPFISYPSEWSFKQLKLAALFHLDFHLFLLNNNFNLSDATPYNVSFVGSSPIFIDVLSIEKYNEGAVWTGYNQFCQLFLFPLILTSKKGINFNPLLSCTVDGFDIDYINNILSFSEKFSPSILLHVVLPYLFKRFKKINTSNNQIKLHKGPSKKNLINLLKQLRFYISNLNHKINNSIWDKYENNNFYLNHENEMRQKVLINFIKKTKPARLIDFGCNTGIFSEIALKNNVQYVVGLDFDYGALDLAESRAKKYKNKFLTLRLDAKNPTPNFGWHQSERVGILERSRLFRHSIFLAFSHHMIIGNNVGIKKFIDWMVDISEEGLVEFIPKNDPAVLELIKNREDIFFDYNISNFSKILSKKAYIISTDLISNFGRTIFHYKKK